MSSRTVCWHAGLETPTVGNGSADAVSLWVNKDPYGGCIGGGGYFSLKVVNVAT